MDAASLVIAGVAAGAPVVASMFAFAMKLDRRLTRIESALKHHLQVDIDLSDPIQFR